MTTYVAERAKTVAWRAAHRNLREVGPDELTSVDRHRTRQDDWKWIPDPADVEVPTPAIKPRPSSVLMMALAWANAH